MQARRDSIFLGEALKPVDTASEMTGNGAVGFLQCPLQQRVMASQNDVRYSTWVAHGFWPRAVRCEPDLDSDLGEKQFSRSFGAGYLLPGDEVVNLSLLDPQKLCDLAGG